jgi:hypothetical protein
VSFSMERRKNETNPFGKSSKKTYIAELKFF